MNTNSEIFTSVNKKVYRAIPIFEGSKDLYRLLCSIEETEKGFHRSVIFTKIGNFHSPFKYHLDDEEIINVKNIDEAISLTKKSIQIFQAPNNENESNCRIQIGENFWMEFDREKFFNNTSTAGNIELTISNFGDLEEYNITWDDEANMHVLNFEYKKYSFKPFNKRVRLGLTTRKIVNVTFDPSKSFILRKDIKTLTFK